MVLNARRKELIQLLEDNINNPPMTIEKLASLMRVSHRTIRYDLEHVDEELTNRGYHICKKGNKGVWLEHIIYREDRNIEKTVVAYDYALSREERRNAIIIFILDCPSPVATELLAEKLAVSRSTLLSDLDNVRLFLRENSLVLSSQRGLGLWIEGEESLIRRVLISIFSGRDHNFMFSGQDTANHDYESDTFRKYVEELPVESIVEAFISLVQNNDLPYNDFSINYMVVSLLVQIKRLRIGKSITQSVFGVAEDASNTFLYKAAQKLAEHLSVYHTVIQNEAEVNFMILQLLSSKIPPWPETIKEGAGEKDTAILLARNLAEVFVKHCQMWLGDIYADDEELLYGLALHLQPAIQRAKYGIKLSNPMLPQIREKYRSLFLIAVKALQEVEEKLGTKLSEDEIGYLTIHLGAAIERKKIRPLKKVKVLLVCGNGIGTAKLLSMTLQNRIPYLDIIRVISIYEWKQQDLNGIDIVISTVPIKAQGVAVLHVSPILSDTETQVIEDQISYLYNKKLTPMSKGNLRYGALVLKDVLFRETIGLDVRADSWENAIVAAGGLLVSTGAVQERYIVSMIEYVKKLGPYIVVAPGIAMPHARTEDGVNRICLSMVRLSVPVPFGNQTNDPVELVFALGAMDRESHLQVLSQLGQIFSDKSAIDTIRTSPDVEPILDLVARYSDR